MAWKMHHCSSYICLRLWIIFFYGNQYVWIMIILKLNFIISIIWHSRLWFFCCHRELSRCSFYPGIEHGALEMPIDGAIHVKYMLMRLLQLLLNFRIFNEWQSYVYIALEVIMVRNQFNVFFVKCANCFSFCLSHS